MWCGGHICKTCPNWVNFFWIYRNQKSPKHIQGKCAAKSLSQHNIAFGLLLFCWFSKNLCDREPLNSKTQITYHILSLTQLRRILYNLHVVIYVCVCVCAEVDTVGLAWCVFRPVKQHTSPRPPPLSRSTEAPNIFHITSFARSTTQHLWEKLTC